MLHLFDCDGVLLDTNTRKTDAVYQALVGVGCTSDLAKKAAHDFSKNFGRTRQEHFDKFQEFGDEPGFSMSNQMKEDALRIYGCLVKQLYLDCPVIEINVRYLASLTGKQMYVVSASDQVELRHVLSKKVPIFEADKIYGGPQSKIQNIKQILRIEQTQEAVLFGDSVKDGEAAAGCGIQFIGLTQYSADPASLKRFCEKLGFSIYRTCGDIKHE